MIQSRMALFRLLVSSDRALDAPFWICARSVCKLITRTSTYEVCNVNNFFTRSLHQAILKPWYHHKQVVEYSVFSSFPAICVRQILHDERAAANSGVKVSSGAPSSSLAPMRWMPLSSRVWTEQSAWRTRPKCLP